MTTITAPTAGTYRGHVTRLTGLPAQIMHTDEAGLLVLMVFTSDNGAAILRDVPAAHLHTESETTA